ncbi:hypothetical protein ACQF4J_44400 [Streptomyces sp. C1-1]|uniref:hypothetical protein n=1 Tax=Streptomyces sp. C1-1 TaxID=3231173 RepID=UPI003CFF793D
MTLWTDGGGKFRQALEPVVGSKTVARWSDTLATSPYQGIEPGQMRSELTWINGSPGVVFRGPDRVIATLTLDVDPEGRITTIHNVANPDKPQAVTAGTQYSSITPAVPKSWPRSPRTGPEPGRLLPCAPHPQPAWPAPPACLDQSTGQPIRHYERDRPANSSTSTSRA